MRNFNFIDFWGLLYSTNITNITCFLINFLLNISNSTKSAKNPFIKYQKNFS
ncbi:hypothetical protein FEDK69T_16080 [Flavobacterium enshiense DK69]|nr:hypothetical protein FEDK69T_16080 [Flavobacterium enshiense DK69]